MTLRFLPVGPRTMLVELPDLDRTLDLFDALTAAPLPQIAEIVPAARTLMVRTAPGVAADGRLAAAIAAVMPEATARRSDPAEAIEIPLTYDGEDLAEVAGHLGLSVAETIAAHGAAVWQVAFTGFAPGFAYMTCDDPRFDLPRRASPRPRIPAGAVALAGRFCGVYPKASPGGWQLIGTTPVPMWDMSRDPPALLRPGARVRFVERRGAVHPVPVAAHAQTAPATGLRVLSAAFPILMQDAGRPGQAADGISASGAMDLPSLRRANRRAGNPPDLPALEITLGPVRLTVDSPVTLVLDGAADRAEIEADGARVPVDLSRPFALDPGEVLVLGPPRRGMRSYLALRGGFGVDRPLGSASTDTLAGIGPEPLGAGAVIGLACNPAGAVDPAPAPRPDLPAPGETVTLPVTMGPRADWFPQAALDLLLSQDWQVTPQSSRVGIRLSGQPLIRADARELPSEGTERGAIQVPHSGQPVLFLADHPLTGGYPVIATLLPEALALAGQIPPGARIRFAAAHPFSPIEPMP
ncbi:5-oxoprolinase/urea amidolyase family protein [Paracoccus subflavus]|uniref:5-oxoprolinase/urea amidolyase family protein n=1 Tax=Paracoccus subflavus TaxID=2528244 RepID=A0A4V2JCK3_9RHOB|nr:urea amidolyase family protein [Paracoccus subflavus]TBN42428.1 5-oxoprolinase/urea amidolyase family protein [Paracoccus subflavus]